MITLERLPITLLSFDKTKITFIHWDNSLFSKFAIRVATLLENVQ